MPFGVTLALSLSGLIMFMVDRRSRAQHGERVEPLRKQSAITLLLVLITIVYSATLIVFIVSGRYRVPLLPYVFLGAAYALAGIGHRFMEDGFSRVALWCWLVIGLHGV